MSGSGVFSERSFDRTSVGAFFSCGGALYLYNDAFHRCDVADAKAFQVRKLECATFAFFKLAREIPEGIGSTITVDLRVWKFTGAHTIQYNPNDSIKSCHINIPILG